MLWKHVSPSSGLKDFRKIMDCFSIIVVGTTIILAEQLYHRQWDPMPCRWCWDSKRSLSLLSALSNILKDVSSGSLTTVGRMPSRTSCLWRFPHLAHNNDIVLNFSVILIYIEEPKSSKDYLRIGSNLMGFELGYKGERKKKRTKEKPRLS